MRYNHVLLLNGFLGSIIGMIAGARKSKKDKAKADEYGRKADELMPPLEDAFQRLFYEKLSNKALSSYTGSGVQNNFNQLRDLLSSATESAVSMGTGGGADLLSLFRAQANVGGAYNKVLQDAEQRSMQYSQLEGGVLENMVQRRLELQMVPRLEARADQQAYLRSSEQNKQLAIASGVNLGNQIFDTLTMGLGQMGNKAGGIISGMFGGGSNGGSENAFEGRRTFDYNKGTEDAYDYIGTPKISLFD